MRKTLLLIAGILLVGVGIGIGWFAARRAMPEMGQKGGTSKVEEAAFEAVAEAEQVLRLAGFDQAFVYRWGGAALDGYVVVDTPQGTERKRLGPFPEKLEDPSFRGLVVVAIRPKVAGVAGRECIWALMGERKTMNETLTSYTRPQSGRLPDWGGAGGSGHTSRHTSYMLELPGGQERELFNFELLKRE